MNFILWIVVGGPIGWLLNGLFGSSTINQGSCGSHADGTER